METEKWYVMALLGAAGSDGLQPAQVMDEFGTRAEAVADCERRNENYLNTGLTYEVVSAAEYKSKVQKPKR